MAGKNLHAKPFDETTITKLKLFEDYAQAWLPTFILTDFWKEIHIFDFFAGTGYDLNGVAGSPIRLLDKIIEQRGYIFQKKKTIVLHLNEYDKKKYQELQYACNEKLLGQKGLEMHVKMNFYNEDFTVLFDKLFPFIEKFPALVYLDQNGVKFLSDNYFLRLERTKQTDFFYFASSSYLLRFGESEEFKKYITVDSEALKRNGNQQVHSTLTELLREKLPMNSNLKLYPFSLKKGQNIYGIIFGASHELAVDKFLGLAWKYNGTNGTANFDIDDEALIPQLDLFSEQKLSKLDSFKQEVSNKILNGVLKNNAELLNFVFERGHIGSHASDCLKDLKKAGKIHYEGKSPCVTYDNVYKKENIVHYEKI